MATTFQTGSKILTTILPSTITYAVNKEQNQQQPNANWAILSTPIQKLGVALRNAFYLPWYNDPPSNTLTNDHSLATRECNMLTGKSVTLSEEMKLIKNEFSMRDIDVRLEGDTSRIFTVRVFLSERPVQNKKLQLILFSYNGNQEQQTGSVARKWEPLTLSELSESPLLVLKAFQKSNVRVDSFVTTSLGNVVLDSLKQKSVEQIPSKLVLNRPLSSVKKVADQLYSFPINHLLYGAAKLTGWDADPEQGLLHFLTKNSGEERSVMIIEAQEDFYFSKMGSLNANYHKELEKLGTKVFRAAYYPFPFHARSHHALSLDHLVNNQLIKLLANSTKIPVVAGEKVSSMIAKNVFLVEKEDFHTCFYVCGNDATLDIGTVRDALPLLTAFVEEGKKMQTHETEEMTG